MVAWLFGGEYERSGRLSSAVRHGAARLAYAPSAQVRVAPWPRTPHAASPPALSGVTQGGGVFAPSSGAPFSRRGPPKPLLTPPHPPAVGAAAAALQHTRTPRHVSCVQFDGEARACALPCRAPLSAGRSRRGTCWRVRCLPAECRC